MTSTSYSHRHRHHRHLEDVHEDSFRVHYRINALSKSEALSIVDELRYEQTVELPNSSCRENPGLDATLLDK